MDAFDIAGLCAHPDDAELVMGGTIAREAARGRRVALVDLTRGESGSRGTPETRAAEAQEAARILGVAHRESLGLPDARLAVVPEHKDPMVEALRRLRPRVVMLQHWEQRHPDHAAASRIVYDACFLAGLRNYRPDLGPAFRPREARLRGDDDRGQRHRAELRGGRHAGLGDEDAGHRGLREPVHARPRARRARCPSTASRRRSSWPAAATARGSACATARAS